MKRILFALAAVALLLPSAQVSKGADVSVDFFYNNLSGGDWIEVADYGYVWQPSVAVSNTSWRPYSDGYWAYTDVGYTWVSYEDFGWATYHYGRWSRLSDYGWVWVPGRDEDLEWGPAWVSWRTGGNHIGWAPLPPSRERIYEGRAISGRVDIDFDIGPSYYNFVDVRYIGEPVLRERIINVNQNVTFISQTTNVTNITYKNNTVYNYGPDINVLNAGGGRQIQRLKIERQENADLGAAFKSGALVKPQGDKLVIAAPQHIRKAERQIAPPKIKTKVAKANIDNGWSGVSDPSVKAQMQQKMKTEDATQPQVGAAGQASPAASASAGANVAGQVGPSPAASASASVSAVAGASAAPFEKGKGKRDKLNEQSQQNAAGAVGASPARGALPAQGASPAAAASAAQAATMPEGGKHKGKHADKLQSDSSAVGGANTGAATTSSAGATSSAETTTLPKRGDHKGKPVDQFQSGPPATGRAKASADVTSPPAGAAAGAQESVAKPEGGKHPGRRFEQPPSGPQSPVGGAQLQDGGAVGKHTPEKELYGGKRSAPPAAEEGAAAQGQQSQGQGKGAKKPKAEEAVSPVPSPQ